MKIKKCILLFCLILSVKVLTAQTYYYNYSKVFNESGYTYNADVNDDSSVTLYDRNSQYVYAKRTFKDGTPLSDDYLLGRVALVEKDNWTFDKAQSIINNAFTPDDKERLKDDYLQVNLIIDPNTGKVLNVYFWFHRNQSFASIPVITYRSIEMKLKNEIWFTVAEGGKKLNFIKLGWMHKVK